MLGFLRRSGLSLSSALPFAFAELATTSAQAFQAHAAQETDHEERPSGVEEERSHGSVPWIDDNTEPMALAAHHRSAAYRELHRPAMTTSGMGLFGGEPGFEKAYRVWVDPDRPHMKHIYNQTPLAKNLRYARYGYFKRDMHLLDIDKLVRHARMLPTPNRLLGDFLYQRVSLSDKSCAALLHYQRNQITMVESWRQTASLQCAIEMFERMVVTNLPPVDVGPLAHAEMIRCCAVSKDWTRGWEVYYQRAREVEEETAERSSAVAFTLGSAFFDAVLSLCVACERPEEGLLVMAESIQRHLRPRASMLAQSIALVSIAMEALDTAERTERGVKLTAELRRVLPGWCSAAASTPDESSSSEMASDTYQAAWNTFERCGRDLWGLYDFYDLQRKADCVEAYMRFAAVSRQPLLAMETLRFADAAVAEAATTASTAMSSDPAELIRNPDAARGPQPTLECIHYFVYALYAVGGLGDVLLELFAGLRERGLQPDYVLFTLSFTYCALHRDGELAVAVYEQYFMNSGCNPTPEMTLAFTQACAQCETPTLGMLNMAERLLSRMERIGSPFMDIEALYDALLELAGQVGAVASAFSKVKVLAGYGVPLTTRMMNSLLLANANAEPPNGCADMTEQIMQLFHLPNLAANDVTLELLEECLHRFGTTERLSQWYDGIAAKRSAAEATGGTLGSDPDLTVECRPPHRMRALKVKWFLSPRDIALRRHGQFNRLPPKEEVGSMLGSAVPFGRNPGERSVF